MATILDLLKQRRDKAEENMDGFRTHISGLDEYLEICECINFFSYLKAASYAPLTMNPEKIHLHFSKISQFLISKATEEEKSALSASANEFISDILSRKLTSVKEYSINVNKWITTNIPPSIKAKASKLAGIS